MKSHQVLLLIAFALLSTSVAAGGESPQHCKLAAVPFTDVKVQDDFWAARIQTNRERSLPHNFKWCEQTGRISNFAKAGGLMPGKFEGIFFNDSDVYKVLEGASYSLADRPDPALAKITDDVIAKIAAAQRPDGYLYCFYTLVDPGKRWFDLQSHHEMYCGGHMIEAAVAHYRATGKRNFLDVAVKYADCLLRTFGPDKRHEIDGHEEIELALVKLYQATGDKRYFDLAKFFIDIHGDKTQRPIWGDYCQDHIPVRQQSEIVGHAVRAMYLYSGVADVAAHSGDQKLIDAMGRLWKDVVQRKMYITGGIGARHAGEAFGTAYELPNDSAYCETCAAIGLALWAHRLNLMHGDAQYADVLERAIYNGILSGIALDGQKFFYVNPLASNGGHHREPFFGCACCPSNVVRFVPSVPGYVYAVGKRDSPLPPGEGQGEGGLHDALYVNLYVAGTATVKIGGSPVKVTQETRYPWDGKIKITLEMEKPLRFALYLRDPEWHRTFPPDHSGKPRLWNPGVTVSGEEKDRRPGYDFAKGYTVVGREWKSGDVIDLNLGMDIRRIEAHPSVTADAGRVAIQRGPIVYCFEAVDNGGHVKNIRLAKDPKFTAEYRKDLLGGVTVITGEAADGRKVTAVPYYAWDHREPGEMAVWVRQDGKPIVGQASSLPKTVGQASSLPKETGQIGNLPHAADPDWQGRLYRPLDPATLGPSTPPSDAELTTATASHCHAGDATEALNDGIEPKASDDHDIPRFTWWDHRGTKEWVQYDFPAARKVSAVAVYWFDDARRSGGCRVPQSWRLLYKSGSPSPRPSPGGRGGADADAWKPVPGVATYGTDLDKFNRVSFPAIETKALRIEAQLQPGFSAGILEWKVEL